MYTVPFAVTLATLLALASAPAAAANDECDAVAVRGDGDACGRLLALSADGDARGSGCRGIDLCITVAPRGSSTNEGPCKGAVTTCVAISGTGNATNEGTGDSACGGYAGAPSCIAFSGSGDASNRATAGWTCGGPTLGTGCIAASGTGRAANRGGTNACGHNRGGDVSVGCIAVSGTGDARNEAAGGIGSCGVARSTGAAYLPLGLGVGCIAVSATGNASNAVDGADSCGFSSVFLRAGGGYGCVAASGTGDAVNRAGERSCGEGAGVGPLDWRWGDQEDMLTGPAAGCVAISGTGDASNDAGEGSCGLRRQPVPPQNVAAGCVAASGHTLLP